MPANYYVPKNLSSSEYEVKKSRFICWIAPVSSREEALLVVQEAKQKYPDARHHCWACIIGNPDNAVCAAAHDDGEPSGTAGKPILNVLQHKNIGDAVAIVIRYFGGIKLGAGGLVRAYSQATQIVTENLELIEKMPQSSLRIECAYSDEPSLRRWLNANNGKILSSAYQQTVVLEITLASVSVDQLKELVSSWRNASVQSR